MAEQFRAGPVEVHPIGGDRRLLLALRTGRTVEASAEDADLLLSCQLFRPLDEVAANEARRRLATARRLTAKGPRGCAPPYIAPSRPSPRTPSG